MIKALVACLVLVACTPKDPYMGRPMAGGGQATDDPMWDACQQQANEVLATCNGMLTTHQNTNSGWELRGNYDRIAKTCPTHAHDGLLGNLEQCVTKTEAFELQDDPQAPARRHEASSRVAATREDAKFKELIAQWTEALDGKNITCRAREASESHARECERWHAEMEKVEDQLRAFLVAEGYDRRDLRPLGLWPSDPDWRTSAN
jgi:hypothetical protein